MTIKFTSLSLHKLLLILMLGAAGALAVVYWLGCRRDAPPASQDRAGGVDAAKPTGDPIGSGRRLAGRGAVDAGQPTGDAFMSPLDTVRLVHRYRCEGRLAAIEPYLVPEQRQAVVEHILSMDELAAASESLKARVHRVVGPGSADAFDRTGIVNAVGPFSQQVECLSERVEGETAVVRIRVGGRFPLESVDLARGESGWMIRTDPPIPGLSGEVRNLARILNQVAEETERRQLSAEQIRRELAVRERPVMKRISDLISSAEPAPGP